MTSEELLKLAERVEQASGPDKRLSVQVAERLGLPNAYMAPDYIASLDAAMLLAGDTPCAILTEAIIRCADSENFVRDLPRFVTAAALRSIAQTTSEGE